MTDTLFGILVSVGFVLVGFLFVAWPERLVSQVGRYSGRGLTRVVPPRAFVESNLWRNVLRLMGTIAILIGILLFVVSVAL